VRSADAERRRDEAAASAIVAINADLQKVALWLRILAGVFFTGMVVTVVVAAFQLVQRGMVWEYMLFRFLTAIIFVVPAYYFAREASKFQKEAVRRPK
jgi:hypothetical protein